MNNSGSLENTHIVLKQIQISIKDALFKVGLLMVGYNDNYDKKIDYHQRQMLKGA